MPLGKCNLCHANSELRDSHYLPRGGYKSTRSASLKNQNPVVIGSNKAKQSQAQVHEFKFCPVCEARFNDGGENWVLRHIHRAYGGVFPIHTILNSAQPIVGRSGFLVFPQQTIPTINIDKLIYFAMSIFWRGTLHWNPVEGNRASRVIWVVTNDRYGCFFSEEANFRRIWHSLWGCGPSTACRS